MSPPIKKYDIPIIDDDDDDDPANIYIVYSKWVEKRLSDERARAKGMWLEADDDNYDVVGYRDGSSR